MKVFDKVGDDVLLFAILLGLFAFFAIVLFWPVSLVFRVGWRQQSKATWALEIVLWGGFFRIFPNLTAGFVHKQRQKAIGLSIGKINLKAIMFYRKIFSPVFAFFFRVVRIRLFNLQLAYGDADAANTGRIAGIFGAIIPTVYAVLERLPVSRKIKLQFGFTPIFSGPAMSASLSVKLTVYPFLMLLLIVNFFSILFKHRKKLAGGI